MPPKPRSRNWNDIQIAIATVSVAATLGLWNLFAEPPKIVTAQAAEPVIPPPPTEEPPTPVPVAAEPIATPQIQTKIMFTQVAPQTSNVVQPQKVKKKKKNNNNNNGGGGGGTVTNTKTS